MTVVVLHDTKPARKVYRNAVETAASDSHHAPGADVRP